MALFPRRIGGKYVMLSRRDRENLHLATSTDVRHWTDVTELHRPSRSWELLQIGNCGSPIETEEGWLVVTHGVGPMRRYVLGALLLDLDDPRRVDRPAARAPARPRRTGARRLRPERRLLVRRDAQRRDLVLPYGMSDGAVGIAVVSVPDLLTALRNRSLSPTRLNLCTTDCAAEFVQAARFRRGDARRHAPCLTAPRRQ